MTEPRCTLSDLPVSSCGHCTGAEARAAQDRVAYPPGTRVTARYPGRCADCDEPVCPGDLITVADGGHGWLCNDCTAP